jgi:undecaprenyl-diphosphatase
VGWLDPVFLAGTIVGYAGLVWIALAAAVALRNGLPVLRTTLLVAGTVWLTDLITLVVKLSVGRPRPFEVLPEADPLIVASVGPSFPSGHASMSAAGAIVLSSLAPRLAPLLALLAVVVTVSRVYVGVHFPLDVLAGAALGTVVGTAVVLGLRRLPRTSGALRRSAARPPRG